ncbi:hypothetical protein Pint_26330 [Pistacia integerrima]|uniref:Uncharacterized protein n=1 Tax=Pistacia integerrima TaxID=434235 RepID=A0ACC0YGW0_9ROSI|nr:hypothetical protein Pint_26330 [Pistacia integerrima]
MELVFTTMSDSFGSPLAKCFNITCLLLITSLPLAITACFAVHLIFVLCCV